MANWASIAWSSVNGGKPFDSYDRMTQDMLRTHLGFRDLNEYGQLKIPLLKVFGGSAYSSSDIKACILNLLELDIHSFVVLESSTYCLTLLQQLLDIIKVFNDIPVSLSISESYHRVLTDKWGGTHQLNGVIIRMTKRKPFY